MKTLRITSTFIPAASVIMDSLFMFIKTCFLSCLTITIATGIRVLISLYVFITWIKNQYMDSLYMFFKTWLLPCLTITMAAGIRVLVSLNVFIAWATNQYMDSLYMFFKTWLLSCLTITMAAGIGVLVSLNVFIVHCPYLEKYIIRSIALDLFAMKIKCHSQLLRLYVSPQSLIYSTCRSEPYTGENPFLVENA